MGALHAGHLALFRAAREECDLVVASQLRQPGAVRRAGRPRRVSPRPRGRRRAPPRRAGVDVLFVPAVDEIYPPGFATWVDAAAARRTVSRASTGPGHFRGVATVCLKLFNIVRPQRAYFGRKDAQQVAVIKQLVRDLDLDARDPRRPDRPRCRRARALVAQRAPLRRRPRAAPSRSRARSRPATRTGPAPSSPRPGSTPEYVAVADLDGPTLAVAVLVGSTRLIDNVQLEGDPA